MSLAKSAFWVSLVSVAWTLTVGSIAIAAGVVGSSLALVTFGAIRLLDSVGSTYLVVHFWHGLRHGDFSGRRERFALWVVTGGLTVIGVLTVADSAYRFFAQSKSGTAPIGVVLGGGSVIVLAMLAAQKRKIGGRLPSRALLADGSVSRVGAIFAAVTLAGGAMAVRFGRWWLDPVAAMGVACGAIGLSRLGLRPSVPTKLTERPPPWRGSSAVV